MAVLSRLIVLSALIGCGDPLVGTDYRGDPLFVIEGPVVSHVMMTPVDDLRFRAAAFWINGTLIEQPSVSAEIQLSGDYALRFFRPPEPASFATPQEARGLVLVYADRDQDGRFGAGDEVLGGTLARGFVYATGAGFSDVPLSSLCSGIEPSEPRPDGRVELIISGRTTLDMVGCP